MFSESAQSNLERANLERANLEKANLEKVLDENFIDLKEGVHFYRIIHKGKSRILPSSNLINMMVCGIKSENGSGFIALRGFDIDKYGIRSRDSFQFILFRHLSSILFNRNGQSKASFSAKIPLYKYNHFSAKEDCTPDLAENKAAPLRLVNDLHFDPNILLFAQGYGPVKNAIGGELVIARVHDYCRDYDISLLELLEYFSVNGQLYPTVKEEYLNVLLKQYSCVIPTCKDNPIVFIDNRISVGVMHGTTAIRLQDHRENLQRYYFYTSIRQR